MKNKKTFNIINISRVYSFRTITFLCLLLMFPVLKAKPEPGMLKKHTVKLDIIPLYSVLFDVRKQLRLGLEYQRNTDKRYFRAIHLDAGLYDDYTYFKYHDFFNQDGGLYHTRQDVKTYGFHLMPAWHYSLSRPGSVKRIKCLAGITTDLNMFAKKIKTFNSKTLDASDQTFRQARLGMGIHIGMTYRISPVFHVELKGILIAKLITWQSDKDMKNIKPFKSVWFDDHQNFWFIPQINLCYDF